MSRSAETPVSFGRRVSMLAEKHPDRDALIYASSEGKEVRLSWSELDKGSNRAARVLIQHGTEKGSIVAVALPNSIEHVIATYAAWKAGASVLSLRAELPDRERDQILTVANPKVVVGDWGGLAGPTIKSSELLGATTSSNPLPDVTPPRSRAIASGGSTGRPKVVMSAGPASGVPGKFSESVGRAIGFRPGQIHLLTTPLFHTNGFGFLHLGLFEDQTVVLMERFVAARAVELIEGLRVNFVVMVPTMLQRVLQVPDLKDRDFSSLEALVHGGAPCPPWVKEAWFDILGPKRCYEAYGTTEGIGITAIRGDEWLLRRGTVGRPQNADVLILDDEGNRLAPGEVGEIFMRPFGAEKPPFEYLGGEPARLSDHGFASVGDLGWVDEDGYLYIADRRTDLIITGGANVYPAEVEAALSEHPEVLDVAVIGLPDTEWGQRVHAVVRPRNLKVPPEISTLDSHVRERLSAYKAPKTYEFVDDLPRDEDAGKMRRSALIAGRV